MRAASAGAAATSGGAGIDGVDEAGADSFVFRSDEHAAAVAMIRHSAIVRLVALNMVHIIVLHLRSFRL